MAKGVRKTKKLDHLAAKAVIRKTKVSPNLSIRERDFAAGLLLGEEKQNSPEFDNPLVQEAVIEALTELGVDNKFIAKHLKEGLEANETKFFAEKGVVTDEREVVNWGARHRYFETLLSLARLKQDQHGGPLVGNLHLHYKSNLRKDHKVIDVSAPNNVQGRRRLEAAKPTNRRGI